MLFILFLVLVFSLQTTLLWTILLTVFSAPLLLGFIVAYYLIKRLTKKKRVVVSAVIGLLLAEIVLVILLLTLSGMRPPGNTNLVINSLNPMGTCPNLGCCETSEECICATNNSLIPIFCNTSHILQTLWVGLTLLIIVSNWLMQKLNKKITVND